MDRRIVEDTCENLIKLMNKQPDTINGFATGMFCGMLAICIAQLDWSEL